MAKRRQILGTILENKVIWLLENSKNIQRIKSCSPFIIFMKQNRFQNQRNLLTCDIMQGCRKRGGGWHICPPHYYVPLQIFRPCDGPVMKLHNHNFVEAREPCQKHCLFASCTCFTTLNAKNKSDWKLFRSSNTLTGFKI